MSGQLLQMPDMNDVRDRPWRDVIRILTEARATLDLEHYVHFSHGFRSGYTSMTNILQCVAGFKVF